MRPWNPQQQSPVKTVAGKQPFTKVHHIITPVEIPKLSKARDAERQRVEAGTQVCIRC